MMTVMSNDEQHGDVAATAFSIQVEEDPLSRPQVKELLEHHMRQMQQLSPCGGCNYLDLRGFVDSSVKVFTLWHDGSVLVGCGALQELDDSHGELKSLRTVEGWERRGCGRRLVQHMLDVSRRERGYTRISLETGSTEPFQPAVRLYESMGFQRCEAFGQYALRKSAGSCGESMGSGSGSSSFNVYFTIEL